MMLMLLLVMIMMMLQGWTHCSMHDVHHLSAGHHFQAAQGHALGHLRAVCGFPNQACSRARALTIGPAGQKPSCACEAPVHLWSVSSFKILQIFCDCVLLARPQADQKLSSVVCMKLMSPDLAEPLSCLSDKGSLTGSVCCSCIQKPIRGSSVCLRCTSRVSGSFYMSCCMLHDHEVCLPAVIATQQSTIE